MKRYIAAIVLAACCFVNFSLHGEAQQPDYEKYGRIAIAVVKEDYPGDEVKEYQYMGRKKISETKVEDSFRFQVTENNQNVMVNVQITHDVRNNKLLTITVVPQKQ